MIKSHIVYILLLKW